MHFLIINASPNKVELSNTARVIDSFQKGIKKAGGTVEIYNLSQRTQWNYAERAFSENENIVFALPVFAATIPGIMMEYLENINFSHKIVHNKKISFIVQSGFPEANQRRYAENYLKELPVLLGAEFSGVLSYGINSRFIDNKEFDEVLRSFENIGYCFVENNGTFLFDEAENFTGAEYLTEAEAKKFNRMFNFFCKHIAESKGCSNTDYQPSFL